MKINNLETLFVLQGSYGFGYEDVTQSSSCQEIKADLKSYRDAGDYSVRIISRRVANPDYVRQNGFHAVTARGNT